MLVRQAQGASKTSLVELRGLEPLTPTLPVWCATSCATAPNRPGWLPEPWATVQGGDAGPAQGRRPVSALQLRDAEVVAERVAQPEVDAVTAVLRLLHNLDTLA